MCQAPKAAIQFLSSDPTLSDLGFAYRDTPKEQLLVWWRLGTHLPANDATETTSTAPAIPVEKVQFCGGQSMAKTRTTKYPNSC